jgi:hypothetical protein
MQASPFSSPITFRKSSPSTRFNAVILYEDFRTGTRAQKGCDLLASEFGEECEFTHSLWRSDLLADPQLRACIVSRVIRADLVIISVHSDLGSETNGVVNAWLAQKGHRDSVLLAVFDRVEARPFARTPFTAQLAMRARRYGLDFFEQTVNEAGENRYANKLKLIWVF